MSINQAAIHYNLPYSSLYGRFKRCKRPPQVTSLLVLYYLASDSNRFNSEYSDYILNF